MQSEPDDLGESSADLGELDDMLADMQGETTETVGEVQARVTALIAAVNHNANADLGAGPQGAPPPPVVVLDSFRYNTFGPQQLRFAVEDSIAGGIVELIIRRDGRDFSITDLEAHVSKIKSARSGPARPGLALMPYEQEIARQLTACQPSLAALRTLTEDQDLDVPPPQAAAVIRFHETYPQVWPQLVTAGVKVKFNSRSSDARGGALFDNNTIHISKLLVTPAGAFVRLLVHEIGHALFETKLLDKKTMPHDLVVDKLTDLSRPVEQAALREQSKKCQEIRDFWDGMSGPAKTLYQAWRTLRRNGGEHLPGIDLWQDPRANRLSPEQRQQYQAGNFGEFCAEVFMLYALGDLQAHVLAVLSRSGIGQDVKTAWKNAWHVLETKAAPILGPRVNV
jgi:hypothetical protein